MDKSKPCAHTEWKIDRRYSPAGFEKVRCVGCHQRRTVTVEQSKAMLAGDWTGGMPEPKPAAKPKPVGIPEMLERVGKMRLAGMSLDAIAVETSLTRATCSGYAARYARELRGGDRKYPTVPDGQGAALMAVFDGTGWLTGREAADRAGIKSFRSALSRIAELIVEGVLESDGRKPRKYRKVAA